MLLAGLVLFYQELNSPNKADLNFCSLTKKEGAWWLNAGNPVGSDNRLYLSVSADILLARSIRAKILPLILLRNLVWVHLEACIRPSGPGAWTPEGLIGNVLKVILK